MLTYQISHLLEVDESGGVDAQDELSVDEDVARRVLGGSGLAGLVVEVHQGEAALLEVVQPDEAVLRRRQDCLSK